MRVRGGTRMRDGTTFPRWSPNSSGTEGASTARAFRPRRSKRSTSRPWEARAADRRVDDRRLRPARGAPAKGVRRRVPAHRRVSAPLLDGKPLRVQPRRRDRPACGNRCADVRRGVSLRHGVVLAVFLTLGVVRGDAERGLLQPLVVRPIGRSTVLAARFLGAGAVCVPYVLGVYFATMVLTGLEGSWWPDRIVTPGLELAGAVLLVAALSLLGSVFLSGLANGIAVFMLFGAGLVAGLLDNIGHVLNSGGLVHAAKIAAWIVPFEALYQDALRTITENTSGLTGFLLRLGPFGGAEQGGVALRLWAIAYLGIVGALALAGFARRDL